MKNFGLAFYVIAVLALLVGSGCGSAKNSSKDLLAEQEANVRRLGLPLTPLEAVGEDNIPANQNAAIDYQQALLTVIESPKTPATGLFTSRFKPEFKSVASEINKLMSKAAETGDLSLEKQAELKLKSFDPALDRIVQAMKKPKWNFERQWNEGINMSAPDVQEAKTLAQMLAIRAYFRGLKGQVHEAISDLQACMKLGAFYRSEPAMIHVYAGTAIESIALGSTLRIVRQRSENKKMIAALAKLWADVHQDSNDLRVWNFELVSMLHSIALYTQSESKKPAEKLSATYPIEGSRKARIDLLSLYVESNQQWPNSNDFDLYIAKVDAYGKQFEETIQNLDSSYVVESGKDSLMASFVKTHRQRQARLRLAYVALTMILLGPGKSGYELPSFAKENDWLDPYSGKPFLLKASPNGFVLYSVGENKRDDGGISGDQKPQLDFAIGFPKRVPRGL